MHRDDPLTDFLMLSAFSRINLSRGSLTVNPLIVPELKITELSHEDLMRFFNITDREQFHNDYYCKAVLKLSTCITATFELSPNFIHFTIEKYTFWLKCLVVFDEDCKVSELCLTHLALHNLKLKQGQIFTDCKVSEYPTYLSGRKEIFPVVDKIVLQPVTPFPDCINNDQIDSAIRSHFKDFKFPLSLNHQLIIPIKCFESLQFASVFKITDAGISLVGEQFVLGPETEVYLKMQHVNERIPSGIQCNLTHSLIFPRAYTFKSFPKSVALEQFLNTNHFAQFPLSTALIHGPFGAGKRTLIQGITDLFGVSLHTIDLYKEKDEITSNFQSFSKLLLDKFATYDLILLDGFELLKEGMKLRSIWSQISQEYPERNMKLLCCHSYLNSKPLSDYVMGSFDLVEPVKMPGSLAVKQLTQELFEVIPEAADLLSSDDFIGYSMADFADLIEAYKAESIQSFSHVFEEFKKKLKFRKSLQSNTLEIPKVTWDQVAGLKEVKAILQDLIGKMQKSPRPSGVLLHGPPGTGKTLIAKALATQSRFALLPVKGPELLSPYIGESESALRDVFTQARAMSPCIIFFDELDALVPRRGEFGDSVGVSDRMVATFMTEMDKINLESGNEECVFVIGATNRPDLIDPVLLRKGRFDVSILLDAPKTVQERAEILAASCKNLNCHPEIDFIAPFKTVKQSELSPAQIASIAKNASKISLERKLEQLQRNPEESNLLIDPITTEDLLESIKDLKFT